jgi:hypothetical protein
MEPTYFAQYRGFEFQCSPARLGAFAFAPRLVIQDADHSVTLEIPVLAPRPTFDDPTVAAHQAFAHGRRWVDGSLADVATIDEPVDPQLPHQASPLLGDR